MGPRQLIPLLLWLLFLWLPLSDDVGPGLLGPSTAAALLLRDGVIWRRLRGRHVDLAVEGDNAVAIINTINTYCTGIG